MNSNPRIIHTRKYRPVGSFSTTSPSSAWECRPSPKPIASKRRRIHQRLQKKPKLRAKKLQTLLKQLDSEPKKTKKKKRLFREGFTRHPIRIERRFSEPESAPEKTHRRRRLGFHVPVWLRNWVPNPQTIPGFVHISIICISSVH
jgi:hypothetical protein